MLAGRVAVITGASSGIGAALARLFGKEGIAVVIGARRLGELQKVAAGITEAGGRAHAIKCDVTVCEEAENLVECAHKNFGRVDILVNNAGRGHFASVEDTTDAMIGNMFAVNVFALWYTTRPALRIMREQKSGHIINIASMAGKLGYPYNSAYVAAKHACVGFTHALRIELAETGIHATVVCPAGVRTDWASVTEGGSMLPMFSAAGPEIKRIAAERGISLPPIEGVMAPESVAEKILECIRHPVAELYTHAGAHEFAVLAAADREKAEHHQLPVVLGERAIYKRLKGSPQ
jgi:short-subunit dehydrogenase